MPSWRFTTPGNCIFDPQLLKQPDFDICYFLVVLCSPHAHCSSCILNVSHFHLHTCVVVGSRFHVGIPFMYVLQVQQWSTASQQRGSLTHLQVYFLCLVPLIVPACAYYLTCVHACSCRSKRPLQLGHLPVQVLQVSYIEHTIVHHALPSILYSTSSSCIFYRTHPSNDCL